MSSATTSMTSIRSGLNGCGEPVVGVAGGAVFLQTDGYVDARCHAVVDLVIGERATPKRFDVGQVTFVQTGAFGAHSSFAHCHDDFEDTCLQSGLLRTPGPVVGYQTPITTRIDHVLLVTGNTWVLAGLACHWAQPSAGPSEHRLPCRNPRSPSLPVSLGRWGQVGGCAVQVEVTLSSLGA